MNEVLGKGGSGMVVLGTHKETKIQYALKFINKADLEIGRIDRELVLLKDIDHTNVIRLFSVYETPKDVCFVLELCTGGHLGDLIARQPRR
jgi:calcium-dependent protein kinase